MQQGSFAEGIEIIRSCNAPSEEITLTLSGYFFQRFHILQGSSGRFTEKFIAFGLREVLENIFFTAISAVAFSSCSQT
jgi:hypothetical protein